MFAAYHFSVIGLWVVLLTVFLQNIIAAMAHRKGTNEAPGKMDESLGHESFVFRSHRTFHNSLENLAVFALPAILAMFVGVTPMVLAILVWTYALARIVHMALYYAIATDKNPSPRSYFFIIGWLANAALFGVVAVKMF